MTTRIESGGPPPSVASTSTAPRVTPAPARPFQEVMHASAHAVVAGAEAAAQTLPGVPILAAAVRSGPSAQSVPELSAAARPEGPTGTAGHALPARGSGDAAVDGFLEHQADLNTSYLLLQERVAAENREYTAFSNILKARHETVKNAIGNIR